MVEEKKPGLLSVEALSFNSVSLQHLARHIIPMRFILSTKWGQKHLSNEIGQRITAISSGCANSFFSLPLEQCACCFLQNQHSQNQMHNFFLQASLLNHSILSVKPLHLHWPKLRLYDWSLPQLSPSKWVSIILPKTIHFHFFISIVSAKIQI